MTPALGIAARWYDSGVYGELRRTCCVYAAICVVSGLAMIETEPSNVLPMWSKGTFCPGRGLAAPFAGTFGFDRSPLPLATKSVWLSGLTASAVGYQPTGMNPFTTEML